MLKGDNYLIDQVSYLLKGFSIQRKIFFLFWDTTKKLNQHFNRVTNYNCLTFTSPEICCVNYHDIMITIFVRRELFKTHFWGGGVWEQIIINY